MTTPTPSTVEFRDVLDLVPQSAVKVDEVTVGKVDDVSLDGYTAVVTVRLNGDVKLPANAFATIRQTSLLGEKFVDLAPPTTETPTGELENGDTIPLSRSGRNPEVEEVLGALSLLLNGGGVAQLKTITQELNKALDGREPQVRSVLSRLDTFMGQLDQNKHEIITAITVGQQAGDRAQGPEADHRRHPRPASRGVEGAEPAALRPGEDAAWSRPVEPRRHPGDPGQQAGHTGQPAGARPDPHPARRTPATPCRSRSRSSSPIPSSTPRSATPRPRRATCTWATTRT